MCQTAKWSGPSAAVVSFPSLEAGVDRTMVPNIERQVRTNGFADSV